MSELSQKGNLGELYINAKGLDDALLELGGGSQEQIDKAMKAAVSRTARWASAQLRKRTAKLIRVSSRVIKGRIGLFFNDGTARLWFGLWAVDLKRMNPRQTASGVVAGPASRKGAFISKDLGGHVYQRTGKSRLPIERVEGHPIEKEGYAALAEVAKEIEPRILLEFERAFHFVK